MPSDAAVGGDAADFEFSPALDPEGEWLAYTSNESAQQSEVYIRPFPGPGGRALLSFGGGRDPVWLPTGGEILYTAGDGYLATAMVRTRPDFMVLSTEKHADMAPTLRCVANHEL